MRKLLSFILLLGASALMPRVYSQTVNPPPPPATTGTGGSTSAPVDGAAGALLIIVAGYGYLKLKKKEDANTAESEQSA
jgi:hypothetical protein